MAESVIEKAKQHFLAQASGELKSVDVPEWETTIYFRPLNLKQQDRIYQYIREGSLESIAETLIVRALNSEGEHIFRKVHKTELMNMVDPGVMNRIVLAMGENAEEELDAEEFMGN